MSSPDLLASCAIIVLVVLASASHAARAALFGPRDEASDDLGRTIALPVSVRTVTAEVLGPIARTVVAAGLSANAVTGFSLAVGAAGGLLLACGHFGLAALAVVVASFGDAVDGLVARRTGTVSPGGALFDASVDRYEEFFLLGGLAFFFRSSEVVLALALLSLLGSFMVSYGSAKAEALGVPVPRGIMRRAERAVFLGVGVTVTPIVGAIARATGLPAWVEPAPIVAALATVAVVANVSAARRIHVIARSATPGRGRELKARSADVARESTADAAE